MVEGVPEFEVEEIVASRFVKRSLQYCVSWKGYPSYDNSWVPAKDCGNCSNLVKEFHLRHPEAARPSAKILSLLAIKLPKAHKNFALAGVPDGGVTPRERGEGDVKPSGPFLALDRGIFPRRRKRHPGPRPERLRAQEDLPHVLDERWVAALPPPAASGDPAAGQARSGTWAASGAQLRTHPAAPTRPGASPASVPQGAPIPGACAACPPRPTCLADRAVACCHQVWLLLQASAPNPPGKSLQAGLEA